MAGRRKNWFRQSGAGSGASYHRHLRFEGLEQRLALTWVGIPPTSIAVPASVASATLNSQGDATGSASIAATEVDYYAFTATSTGAYKISATTPSSNLDTVLGVFSASGKRLAYNDDIVYAVNTDSQLTINLTAGTRYLIGITNYSRTSRGSYTWTIDGPAAASTTTTAVDDAYENNDSFGSAYNLGTLTAARTMNGLVMADAQDWYRLTTTSTGNSASSVSISFQNSQGNLQLALYNSSGSLLAVSQTIGNSETISLNGRAAGTYYVLVYGNNGVLNPGYSLSIHPPAAAQTTTAPPTTPTSTGGFQITLSMSGLTASQQAVFQQAAQRWQQVIVGDLPNATYRGQSVDDILISASARSIDGVNGILGQAGPDAFRTGSDLPYHGVMQFDSADLASMESSGLLFSVVLHEMGHVLGIGTIWEDLGLLSGAGTSNPIFVGAQATAAYNNLFGTSARGVPVENTGGAGTADGHWRETVFGGELMTGWAGPGINLPLSVVTVASLADIGYTVNLAAADAFTPAASLVAAASRAAVRTSSAAVYAFGGAPTFESTVDMDTSTNPRGVVDGTLSTPRVAAERLDANLVDLAMADHGTSVKPESAVRPSSLKRQETTSDWSVVWDEFGRELGVGPALEMPVGMLA